MDFLIGGASRTPHFFLIQCRSHLSMRKNISDSASYTLKQWKAYGIFIILILLPKEGYSGILFASLKFQLNHFPNPSSRFYTFFFKPIWRRDKAHKTFHWLSHEKLISRFNWIVSVPRTGICGILYCKSTLDDFSGFLLNFYLFPQNINVQF